MLFHHKLIQCNLNHCWNAHNLLQQYMREHDIAIAIIAEPVSISERNWAGSSDKKAAIHWRPESLRTRCRTISAREGYVAIKYENIVLFSCYMSPNISLASYERILEELDYEVKRQSKDAVKV